MRLSPQRLQTLCSPTVILVEFIADGILLIKILMVLFRRIELRGWHDFRHDLLLEGFRFVELLLRFFSKPLLAVVMIENRGAILMAFVTELLIGRRGIDIVPEGFQ